MNEIPHKRTIRSFVRREGRMTTGQKKAFDELWPKFGLDAAKLLTDAKKVFGRQGPLVLEIGFGMGDSLAEQASNQLQNNFIGIEVHRPGVGHLLSLLDKHELNNVRVYCADAVEVLNQCIHDHCLDTVQIFFPDPWPKKRHHKRRLIQTPFIELLAKKIKIGGKLHLATDWENYAQHMMDIINSTMQFTNTATDGQFVPRPTSRPLTKFETRGQRLGHGVWDLVYARR